MTDRLGKKSATGERECALSRRQFLWYSGAAIATTTVMLRIPGTALALEAQVALYPRQKIASLSGLRDDKPQLFNYPDEGPHSMSMIVKTGVKCGGGIGSQQDIVAFNIICTHQGGPLVNTYHATHKTLGPCPFHLTTYDTTRYGIIVSGQAYQSLPQVLLEIEGDDVYAVGVMGLIYGRNNNLVSG